MSSPDFWTINSTNSFFKHLQKITSNSKVAARAFGFLHCQLEIPRFGWQLPVGLSNSPDLRAKIWYLGDLKWGGVSGWWLPPPTLGDHLKRILKFPNGWDVSQRKWWLWKCTWRTQTIWFYLILSLFSFVSKYMYINTCLSLDHQLHRNQSQQKSRRFCQKMGLRNFGPVFFGWFLTQVISSTNLILGAPRWGIFQLSRVVECAVFVEV